MTLVSRNGEFHCRSGPADSPDVVVTGPADTIIGLLAGRLDEDAAVEEGVSVGDFVQVAQPRKPDWLSEFLVAGSVFGPLRRSLIDKSPTAGKFVPGVDVEPSMDRTVRVLLVSGSLRGRSTNTAALRTAAAAIVPGVEAVLYEGVSGLPHFNPDDDSDPLPGAVADLRSQIRTADAFPLSTPEYAERSPGRSRTSWTGLSAMTSPARSTRSPSPGSTSPPMVPSTLTSHCARSFATPPPRSSKRPAQRYPSPTRWSMTTG